MIKFSDMFMFHSPLEQFEISSYTTYPTTWTNTFFDLYQYNFFFDTNLITKDTTNFFLIFVIFFFVKIINSIVKINNTFFIFFFALACLTGVYFLTFVDHRVTVYDIDQDFKVFEHLHYALDVKHWASLLLSFVWLYLGVLIIMTLNVEVPNLHRVVMYPTFNHMIGELFYKTAFTLFISTLGKEVESKEFFIKIKTIFTFLIISNLQGMIPYTGTVTSALSNTFYMALALFISIIMTILDKKGIAYFLNLFMPPGCPINLILLLIPIEIISYSFRVVSLSVRLFANMMAGHTLLKVIVGFSWIMVFMGDGMIICNLIPIAILLILTLLEIGVALIQAYIFTILSCIYIRDIFEGH